MIYNTIEKVKTGKIIKWTEENSLPMDDVLLLERLQEKATIVAASAMSIHFYNSVYFLINRFFKKRKCFDLKY